MAKILYLPNGTVSDRLEALLSDSARNAQPISFDVCDNALSGPEMREMFATEIFAGDILLGRFDRNFSLGQLVIAKTDRGLFARFLILSGNGNFVFYTPNRKFTQIIPYDPETMSVRAIVEVIYKGKQPQPFNKRMEFQ